MANALMFHKNGSDGSVSVVDNGRPRAFKMVRGVVSIPEHLVGKLIGPLWEAFTRAEHQPEKPADEELGEIKGGKGA